MNNTGKSFAVSTLKLRGSRLHQVKMIAGDRLAKAKHLVKRLEQLIFCLAQTVRAMVKDFLSVKGRHAFSTDQPS